MTTKTKTKVCVYLGEKFLGETTLLPHSLLGEVSVEFAVKAAIAVVCFLREDDLLKEYDWCDFTVKSC